MTTATTLAIKNDDTDNDDDDDDGDDEVRDRLRESPPGGAATDVGRTAGASPPCGETANCLNQSSQRFIVCLFTARSY